MGIVIRRWLPWVLAVALLIALTIALGACSSGGQARVTPTRTPNAQQMEDPPCSSLLGKALPAAVISNGMCTGRDGSTWLLGGFDCTDGTTFYQWDVYWVVATGVVRTFTGVDDPAYKAASYACFGTGRS